MEVEDLIKTIVPSSLFPTKSERRPSHLEDKSALGTKLGFQLPAYVSNIRTEELVLAGTACIR